MPAVAAGRGWPPQDAPKPAAQPAASSTAALANEKVTAYVAHAAQ
jgi:hypothetical protein